MKKLFTIVFVLMCLSLSVNATHVYLSLTGVTNGANFYYCGTTVDSVITYKPAGSSVSVFQHSGIPNVVQDSAIITVTTQGYWTWSDGFTTIGFYVNFVSIAPTQPWMATDTTKCTESLILLNAQPNAQPDFTYLWSDSITNRYVNVITPGTYTVTITGACGVVSDSIEIINYPVPTPNLGSDIVTCDGNTVTLDPGTFDGYVWSTSASTQTIDVTTDGTYSVDVTDTNGCHGSDAVDVVFDINDGEEIKIVTIDTINGYNKVMWDTLGTTDVTTVILREVSTDVYVQVGSAPYLDGEWTDTVNSMNQTWRYKIATIDTCGNISSPSLYHQTISTATVPLVPSGYRVEWTEYLIEGGGKDGSKSVSNYYVFAVDGLGGNWIPNQIAMVSGSVTSYNLPAITDSMFVVGADLGGSKGITDGLALSNVVDNPLISSVPSLLAADKLSIYPNPSNGEFTVNGEGILTIHNIIGECILTDEIRGTTNYNLSAGVYVVTINNKNAIYTKKVIIQ